MNLPFNSIVWSQFRRLTIDGVLTDHFADYDGWIKGWVMDANTFVTCSHAFPAPAGPVPYSHGWIYVENKKKTNRQWRKIVKVTEIPSTDISICKVDKPFPKWATPLNFVTKIPSKVTVIHKDKSTDTKAVIDSKSNFITLAWEKGEDLIPGDSGLPWLTNISGVWYVVSHSYKGLWGQGPNYLALMPQMKKAAK